VEGTHQRGNDTQVPKVTIWGVMKGCIGKLKRGAWRVFSLRIFARSQKWELFRETFSQSWLWTRYEVENNNQPSISLATHSNPNIQNLAIENLQIQFIFEFLKFEILFLVKFTQ